MNARLATARSLEGHTEMRVLMGANSAVGSELNPRGAELDVWEVVQHIGIGSAVRPCNWKVGETIICANAMANKHSTIGAQND